MSSSPHRPPRSLGRPRALALLALLVGALGASGCGDGSATGLRLELTTDPSLDSLAEVVHAMRTFELVVDSAGGFSQSNAAVALRDVDGDGQAELVLSRAVSGEPPRLRLTAGDATRGRDLSLLARGLSDVTSTNIANGDVASSSVASPVRFSAQDTAVSLAIDLRPELRPPRVDAVRPAPANSPNKGQTFEIDLSTEIDASDTTPGVRLLADSGQAIPLTLTSRVASYDWRGLTVRRTVIVATIACDIGGGRYTLHVDGLSNANGVLDQDRATPQADPFTTPVTVDGPVGAAGSGCATTQSRAGAVCEVPAYCTETGEDLVCARPDDNSKGVCVQREGACQALNCRLETVCAVLPPVATCLPDCRLKPVCTSDQNCDQASGLCKPCQGADCVYDACKKKCGDVCANTPADCQACIDTCVKNGGP